MAKNDNILTGTITNLITGESHSIECQPFFNDAVLTAVVMVESSRIYTDLNYPDEPQVSMACKALDSIGFVYNLNLEFLPETQAKGKEITDDLKTGAIFIVKGRYSMCQSEMIISVNDPEYLPLPPAFDEHKVREAFRMNVNQ
jgi:hypothetical protein